MNRKVCEQPDIKILDAAAGGGEHGSMLCYASTFGNADRVGDIFQPGAFAKSLTAFTKDGFMPVGHDWGSLPVAMVVDAREDEKGLLVRLDFHSTQAAQDARTVVQERLFAGKSVGVSIGFRTVAAEPVDAKNPYGGLKISEAELYEVSLVTVPCNPMAQVLASKSDPLTGLTMEDHSETVLTAVREFRARITDVAQLGEKEGRPLSAANRQRIRDHAAAMRQIADEMEGMADMSEKPKSEDTPPVDILAVQARLAILDAKFDGAMPW